MEEAVFAESLLEGGECRVTLIEAGTADSPACNSDNMIQAALCELQLRIQTSSNLGLCGVLAVRVKCEGKRL